MPKSLPPRPSTRSAADGRDDFAVVVSEYNAEFTRALADAACGELAEIIPQARVELHRVPGAFEIPLAVKLLASRREFAAVLALGVIVRGETAHGDLVAAAVTHALAQIALDEETPVIHEVLLVADEAQAAARCGTGELSRGTEAARAAVAAARVARAIRGV